MYLIINKLTGGKFREATRPSWKGFSYKTKAAATAGITRTKKYYQNAIDDVARVVADGQPEYTSNMYNAFRDATEDRGAATWSRRSYDYREVCNGNALEVVAEADYTEPMVTTTGTSPYNGATITRTIALSRVGTHMDPLCESHYTR
jgi:hypothetical protein|tara:strand:- start:455 stop:895 length:441 start_codon:yes stop_codon:yes gene_type:complete